MPGKVAVTVTSVASADSATLVGLTAMPSAPAGVSSSSLIVSVTPVTVRPDTVVVSMIVSFSSSRTSLTIVTSPVADVAPCSIVNAAGNV